MISQLNVFLENEEGRLASMCRSIADAGVNMHALFVADTEDFGVARIFCDKPRAARDTLNAQGYRTSVTPVVAVHVPNKPGGLADLLEFLSQHQTNIEYGYCFPVDGEVAVDVLKIDDPGIEKMLAGAGFDIVEAKEIYTVD